MDRISVKNPENSWGVYWIFQNYSFSREFPSKLFLTLTLGLSVTSILITFYLLVDIICLQLLVAVITQKSFFRFAICLLAIIAKKRSEIDMDSTRIRKKWRIKLSIILEVIAKGLLILCSMSIFFCIILLLTSM